MKLLVTGGAGFIGVNFVRFLLDSYPEDNIVCVDKLTYAGNIQSLVNAMMSPNFSFFQMDICSRADIFSVFQNEKPEVVVNFAAESHVDRSIDSPEIFLRTNVIGTQVLMDACLEFGVKRFHQISTDEVYGDLPLDRSDLKFSEETPLKTSSPYSASKAGADLLVNAYCRTYKLPATISRCSNNYGPYQFPEKLIPLMITNAQKNKPLPVYGNGLNVRDWLYVEDHCRAIDIIIRNGCVGEIYNIGGNAEMRNIDLVKLVCKILGKPESLIEYVNDRKGHDLRYAIDASKIRKDLGWQPKTGFFEGLQKTVSWYLENERWLDNIYSDDYSGQTKFERVSI